MLRYKRFTFSLLVAFGLLSFLLAQVELKAQPYEVKDTAVIPGKLHKVYDNPRSRIININAGTSIEIPTVAESAPFFNFHLAAQIDPIKYLGFGVEHTQLLAFGSAIQDDVNANYSSARVSLYVSNKEITKMKLFTAGYGQFNYTFNAPMTIRWKFGFTGSYETGSHFFVGGSDSNIGVRYQKVGTTKVVNMDFVTLKQKMNVYSAGLVIGTRIHYKIRAELPGKHFKTRRVHSFTEARFEALYAEKIKTDDQIELHDFNDNTNYVKYNVYSTSIKNTGYRVVFDGRRRLMGVRLEMGKRPGIDYRFSGSESGNFMNRFYFLIGINAGWI